MNQSLCSKLQLFILFDRLPLLILESHRCHWCLSSRRVGCTKRGPIGVHLALTGYSCSRLASVKESWSLCLDGLGRCSGPDSTSLPEWCFGSENKTTLVWCWLTFAQNFWSSQTWSKCFYFVRVVRYFRSPEAYENKRINLIKIKRVSGWWRKIILKVHNLLTN